MDETENFYNEFIKSQKFSEQTFTPPELKLLTLLFIHKFQPESIDRLPEKIRNLGSKFFTCFFCHKRRLTGQHCFCSETCKELLPCMPDNTSTREDVELISNQMVICRHKAFYSLKEHHGDILEAIIALTTPNFGNVN